MTTHQKILSEVDFHRLPKSEVPYSRKSSAGNGLRKSEVDFPAVRKCADNLLENMGKLSEVILPYSVGGIATSANPPTGQFWRSSFGEVPKPDYMAGAQPYWVDGAKLHTTRDGRTVVLMKAGSFCAKCGEPISFFFSESAGFKPDVHRCQAHKAPGRKLGGRGVRP